MLADSGLLNDVGNFAFSPAGQPMCVYGDPAYPLRIHLQAPYSQGRLTQQMEDYNKAMSAVRVSVEWLFGDIINSFKFLDYKKNLKIGLSSVGKNVYCTEFFDLEPPYSRGVFPVIRFKNKQHLFFKVCILVNMGLPIYIISPRYNL